MARLLHPIHLTAIVLLCLASGCTSTTSSDQARSTRALERMATHFDGPQHAPFHLAGGPDAVLLVHGFPGSPDQVRPLAQALHQRGWTVTAMALPGTGRDVRRLPTLTGDEWTSAIRRAAAELSRNHQRVLVIGYSMGGAMVCASLDPQDVDALILIAPYQWTESPLSPLAWLIFRPVMPEFYQPFGKADFSNPETRALLATYFPASNLDDPPTQQDIRAFTIRMDAIARLRSDVRDAFGRKWQHAAVATLFIQGTQDTVALASRTRTVARRWGGPAQVIELPADHLLLKPSSPAFDDVIHHACTFADRHAAARAKP